MPQSDTESDLPRPIPQTTPLMPKLVSTSIVGGFMLGMIFALYFAKDFIMPVVLAFLFALTLTPIVRFFKKRGIPEGITATMLVLATTGLILVLGYVMSGPIASIVNDAPQIGRNLQDRLSRIREPIDHLLRVSDQIESATATVRKEGVQEVVVAQPGILSQAAGNAVTIATTVGVTAVLALFLLASGTMFYEKIIQSFSTLTEKKRALRVVYDVEREISRYLFTIALINGALGIAIGTGLWLLGFPNPLLFGVMAAALNFLPYIGAIITIIATTVIAIVSTNSLGYAMIFPAYVLTCNVIEGQFLTPMIVGRRLELNAVSIFIAVAFWSWLWGFVGALIAVPLLVVVKVFCDHFESLRHVGNFLAAQAHPIEEPETPKPAAAAPVSATT